MNCSQNEWMESVDYLDRFYRRAIEQQVPLSGSVDLTHRCNFSCTHCYLGQQKNSGGGGDELSTSQWCEIIDQIADAGCLFLLLTGGDPLLRSDFSRIYRHVRKKGLIPTLFTNGTTLTGEILATLSSLPPRLVEITLYGASEATYERITGHPRGFSTCIETIHRLLDSDIKVGLKTVLMTENVDELATMEKLAKTLGLSFRHDATIFPGFDGNAAPLQLRIPVEKAAEIDFSDPQRAEQWTDYFARTEALHLDDRLYQCGSGLTTFHVSPSGLLQPCIMASTIQHDLLAEGFSGAWQEIRARVRAKKRDRSSPCSNCDKMALCGICPPFSSLETGKEDGRSEYLCNLGHLRYKYVHGQSYAESQ